jgi:SAM-dependent methyltransferase
VTEGPQGGRAEEWANLESRRCRICPVCGAPADDVGSAPSRLDDRRYHLAACGRCGFAFVTDPRTDFDALYDDDYYAGRGADPAVDYAAELDDRSIRAREWQGIVRIVQGLGARPGAKWLDFGSGYGGLVRHALAQGFDAVGHDLGHPARRARELGTPMLDEVELQAAAGTFAVVTAIEVLEHVLDPRAEIERLASLLGPNGVLFVTTGNVARHRNDLPSWRYVVPDVHISFYEPRTLERLYRECGLRPTPVGYRPGMSDVVAYKVLKSLGRRREHWSYRLVPWSLVSRLADRREGVSAQPAAVRPGR